MIRFTKRYAKNIFFMTAALIALAGCSKVTQENFAKIEEGMTYEEVKKLIGDPASCQSALGIKHCVWKNGKKTIDIKIFNDQVVMFSGEKF